MVDFVFLDSGTGGIPYMMHLLECLPNASCVYIADTIHFPYGKKTHTQIVSFVITLVEKVIKQFSPKVIVLACNTMSVNALDVLRQMYPKMNFVGTVPAIKLAANISKKRKIGLLATKSTINNPYNKDLKKHFANDCKLVLRADSKLIDFIEHKAFYSSTEQKKHACVASVNFFKKKDCDVIILGCTHFLNLKQEIQEVAGSNIKVVDSVEGVINRAIDLSGVLLNKKKQSVKPKLYVTNISDKKCKDEYNDICKKYAIELME